LKANKVVPTDEKQSFLMNLTELFKLHREARQSIQRVDLLLRDHYTGLNELKGHAHGLTCSAHSTGSAIISFIDGLAETSETKSGKIKLNTAEVQNLASMVLLLAEIKMSLEQENLYLELQ